MKILDASDIAAERFSRVVADGIEWECFSSPAAAFVENISEHCRRAGIVAAVGQYDSEAGEMPCGLGAPCFWVAAVAPPARWREIVSSQFEAMRKRQIWQHFGAPPQSLGGWAGQFKAFLEHRWFDSDHPAPSVFPGPDAGDVELLPLLRIGAALGVFDLSDTLTWLTFCEFLGEYAERRELWAAFERDHGPAAALFWHNETGRAYERANASANAQRITKRPATAKGEELK
jgi:hypothetical protein